MLDHGQNRFTLQPGDDLPNLKGKTLYMDLETTSCDDKKDSLNPWRDCWVAGIAIAVDDSPCFYIPVHHRKDLEQCFPREAVVKWLRDVMSSCSEWVNHNVKYDVHALANDFGLLWQGRLIDTRTQAKLLYSDLFNFGLKQLAERWLGRKITDLGDVVKSHLKGSKDFGVVHPRIMGKYAATDVQVNRDLWNFIDTKLDPSLRFIQELEIDVTSMLIDIEREGMRIDPIHVDKAELISRIRMLNINDKIYEITGKLINPKSPDDCYDYFCNCKGLPILKYTDAGNASFDKDTLPMYNGMVGVPPGLVSLMQEYRDLSNFTGLFTSTYRELNIDGVLHSDYNQCVRTGRMSVSQPNSQQLNETAKGLILPKVGYTLVSHDYSQIEFRLITHYMQDPNIIRSYTENPDIDYHQLVAEMAGILRSPAKTLNFQNAFGGGRKKAEATLAHSDTVTLSVIQEMLGEPGQWEAVAPRGAMAEVRKRAAKRGRDFYETYHRTLPELKRKSKAAENACKRNGYVRTLYGRRRHLPADRAYAAFNGAVQGTAADIMKLRAVQLWKTLKGTGASIMALIHDDATQQVPTEIAYDPRYVRDVSAILENVTLPDGSVLSVPIRSAWERSSVSWAEAKKDKGATSMSDLKNGQNLEWLTKC